MHKLRLGICLLALAAAARPQEAQDGPAHPRALWDAFFREMNAAVKGDDEALARAGGLFDMSDVPSADRADLAQRAAKDLLTYLNKLDAKLPTATFPEDPDTPSPFVVRTEFGRLAAVRGEDGVWRISPSTREHIPELIEAVADREAKLGAGAFQDADSWLRDRMPAWLRKRGFLLQHWQWLGLLVLIIVGLVVGRIGRAIAARIAGKAAQRQGAVIDGSRLGRPVGLIAMAAAWLACLRFLALPDGSYSALMLAGRLVLMVGVVWTLSRLVDWLAELVQSLASRTESKLDDLLVPMLRRALKVFVVVLGIVWIADNLDMDIAALLAGLGIGGVALALASKDTVENFFGAIAILADRSFQVGDWILMGDIEGTVTEVGFRTTRVTTFYNSVITFPNAMLIRTAVDNLGARRYRRFKTTLGLTYDTPADKIEAFVEGVRELIRNHPYTRKDYYHVYFHGFGDNSLNVLVYLFFETPDWSTELRERQRLLMDTLRLADALGVDFAFPTRTVHLVQGEMPEHGDPEPSVPAAWRSGRDAAQSILKEFHPAKKPPPVRVGRRPDEALDDDGV